MYYRSLLIVLGVTQLVSSCGTAGITLFEEVSQDSGIGFRNDLVYTEEFNPYTYRNFFNGGGVALGDINNDGHLDIYFTGNLVHNKLYLNKGDWTFKDITTSSGTACENVWSSGATFADINSDGWLDLYVCKSGKPEGENRHNELFINNGDLTFTERSEEYGLNITGLATHAAFFDYDKDGDLDAYLLTNSFRSIGGYDLIENQRTIPDPAGGGNKFLKNEAGYFEDVSQSHGIYTSNIGFGLGITLSDFNRDNWTDIYISNDFFERDYLYLNNEGTGFTESLESYFMSISMGSMGADAADLDNNDQTDLFVTEMLPSTIERKRTKAVYESWDKYTLNVERGYYHQFPRNVLQRNMGNGNFLEIGRFAGVSATDWSWGALIFDMNNDGWKDVFVSNGIYKDLLDRDYLTYIANEQSIRKVIENQGSVIKDLIDVMPSEAIPNHAFKNTGNLKFENVADEWGLGMPSFSNGSAYGDLDNDGDLDLVVNNVNMPSFVFKNKSDTSAYRSLRIRLMGNAGNTYGVGARIMAYHDQQIFSVENFPSRGFESSVDPIVHLGVGEVTKVDSVIIKWPDDQVTKLYDTQTNTLLEVKQEGSYDPITSRSFYEPALKRSTVEIPYRHIENNFVDFDRDRLLPHMFQNEGPALAIGDVNGDGHDDVFLGSSKGHTPGLFIYSSGTYVRKDDHVFEQHSLSEDVDAIFFDCDGDMDLDLFVASGGRAFSKSSSALFDRLYVNNGNGSFTYSPDRISTVGMFSASSVVDLDYDGDGDRDLFVGERFHPFFYGENVRGYILENDGRGFFKDVTSSVAPALMSVPMITDAAAGDFNGDDRPDLAIATEWGPVMILLNEDGKFTDETHTLGLGDFKGWWMSIEVVDFDDDGDDDLVAGNHGRNTFFRDSTRMYYDDFDQNGSKDHIFCEPRNGKYYPIADRNELVMQLPALKKHLLYFKNYASMSIDDIFAAELINQATVLEVTTLESAVFINEGDSFNRQPLPDELQYGPIYALLAEDIDDDGLSDILAGGNQFLVKPQFGRYDALPLSLLSGTAGKGIKEVRQIPLISQVRELGTMTIANRKYIIVVNNDEQVAVYEKRN